MRRDAIRMLALGWTVMGAVLTFVVFHVATDTSSPEERAVHTAMSNILQQEMPKDATELDLDFTGPVQTCVISNKRHRENAAFDNTPHDVKIVAYFQRKRFSKTGWESRVEFDSAWVETFTVNKLRRDGEAVSASDFRQLVRQCVATVRGLSHRQHPWPLTAQENSDSWRAPENSVVASDDGKGGPDNTRNARSVTNQGEIAK